MGGSNIEKKASMSIVVKSLAVMGTVHGAKQNSGHRQGIVRGQQKRSFLLPQPLANTGERFAVRNRIFRGVGWVWVDRNRAIHGAGGSNIEKKR